MDTNSHYTVLNNSKLFFVEDNIHMFTRSEALTTTDVSKESFIAVHKALPSCNSSRRINSPGNSDTEQSDMKPR